MSAAKENSIEPINRLLVDAETAAHLLSISRSLFDLLWKAGKLPQPRARLGRKPLWSIDDLRCAIGCMLSYGGQPQQPPTAAHAGSEETAEEEEWDCEA